jgi:hypothetical protein
LWHTPVIAALGKLKQEDYKFEASLGYIVSSSSAWATLGDPSSKNWAISFLAVEFYMYFEYVQTAHLI